jgi:hypothetical protein
MKKFALMLLALLTVVGVSAFGFEQAGPLGSVAALGLATSAVAYAFNSYDMEGRLFTAIGTFRPLKRGESNLGGLVSIDIFTEEQFTPGVRWPVRAKGAITTAMPLVTLETGAKWRFDVGTGKGDFTASGPITNKTYKHMLEAVGSGYFQEQTDSLDDLYNMGFVAIANYQNGKRVVYGSTQAPLHLTDSGSTGDNPESNKVINIKAESIVGCDFPPRILGSEVVVTLATTPAYPTQVSGVTP